MTIHQFSDCSSLTVEERVEEVAKMLAGDDRQKLPLDFKPENCWEIEK